MISDARWLQECIVRIGRRTIQRSSSPPFPQGRGYWSRGASHVESCRVSPRAWRTTDSQRSGVLGDPGYRASAVERRKPASFAGGQRHSGASGSPPRGAVWVRKELAWLRTHRARRHSPIGKRHFADCMTGFSRSRPMERPRAHGADSDKS